MVKNLEINNTCISCDACRTICPEGAILSDGTNFAIDPWSCTLCHLCVKVCPVECIREES